MKLLTLPETAALLRCTRRHLLRLRQQPDFPRAYRIGEHTVRYAEADLLAWIAQRQEAACSS